jgi:Mg/Co/Ni transporter MgtE
LHTNAEDNSIVEVETPMLNFTATLTEALSLMRAVSERTIFVVRENAVLIGVISEGDLIRAFENNQLLHTGVLDIMNSAPIFSTNFLTREEIIDIFTRTGALLIPIVNDKGELQASQSVRRALRN